LFVLLRADLNEIETGSKRKRSVLPTGGEVATVGVYLVHVW